MAQAKKRVFVSFDFDHDKVLKDFIVGQARNEDSPFEVADWSMKEAAPEREWEEEAQRRINRCDVVIVMLGRFTYKAPGVLREVRMAREAAKPIYQIIGYRDTEVDSRPQLGFATHSVPIRDSIPSPVPNAGRLLRWNWDNLKRILS